MNSYVWSHGQVFSGVLKADGTTGSSNVGSFTSENFAAYAQVEKKFFSRLTMLIGGRWEYYNVADYFASKPIFRAGANLQVGKASFFRASLGQGFRFPSIGERYITTTSGQFGFYPNPNLQAETSLSYELGFKQVFKLGNFVGIADVAGFLEDYDNYIEFNFGQWGHNQNPFNDFGFMFMNTGPAKVYGVDCTVTGEGKIARNLDLNVLIGYTYSVPESTNPNYVYYKNGVDVYTYNKTSSDTSGNILKYRIQNLFKFDGQITYKKFSTGMSANYYGYMKNIDKFFYTTDVPGYFNTGITKYREDHHNGIWVYNYRISYALNYFKISLIVNNLLNTEYSLRPLTIEAPRLTTLQVIYKI